MKRKIALFICSLASMIVGNAWYGGIDSYRIANMIITLFIVLNITTIKILLLGKNYWRTSIVGSITDLITLVAVMIVLSAIFNKSYMSILKFSNREIKKARIYLFGYFIVTILIFIIVKNK